MPRYICHHEGLFFEWSTVVDAPVSAAMTISEFEKYYLAHYGLIEFEYLKHRIARALNQGTSSMGSISLSELISGNRAGSNESELSFDEIINSVINSRQKTGLPLLNVHA